MKMKKADTGEEKVELQMTSMIDVVFLLLIFFIATMEFKEQEGLLRSFLPKESQKVASSAKKQEKDEEKDLQDITITLEKPKSGRVTITVGQAAVPSFRQLAFKLGRLHKRYPDHRVIIDGKPDVDFGYVVKALNACLRAEYRNISFSAPPEA